MFYAFIDWLRIRAKENSIMGHFISAFYLIGGNVAFQLIATLIIPIAMSIFIYLEVDKLFYFTVLCFVISSAIMLLTAVYNSKKKKDTEWFLNSLKSTRDISHEITVNLVQLKNKFSDMSSRLYDNDDDTHFLDELRDSVGFKKVANLVCKEIYEMVENVMHTRKCKVTVYGIDEEYLNDESKNEQEIFRDKMLASYSVKGHEDVTSAEYHYSNYYDKKTEKQHLHIQIIKENRTDIQVCCNKSEVQDKFLFHVKSISREKKIRQYIGIPIYTEEKQGDDVVNNVYSVLQVDVEEDGIFGHEKESIEEFASNNLKPFTTLLRIAFEIDRLTNSIGIDLVQNLDRIRSLEEELYINMNDVDGYST